MRRDLVVRAMSGDDEAFSELAAAARPDLHRVAYLILRHRGPADDAVQNALVAAWRGIGGLRDPDRFAAWLHRLTVRAAYHVARTERSRSMTNRELGHRTRPSSVDDGQHLVAVRDQLDRAFSRLTARERAVLVLRYYLDLSLADAAGILEIPLGTMKSRLNHAQRALRAVMDADERAAPG